VKVLVALVVLPPPAGVALYSHVGGKGGGGDGGGGEGGGGEGGAPGGWHRPSQSIMYSTYTKLPSYAFSLTSGVAVVTKVYVPSSALGNSTILAHSKKLRPSRSASVVGLHLPCTSTPFAVVLTTYSSSSSKSKSVLWTMTLRKHCRSTGGVDGGDGGAKGGGGE
tara:strand:+ start:953 stop:1447 length:495 start_codon:yes stop_codon:yes gene_type:complete